MFEWHAHPDAWLLLGGSLVAYFYLLRRKPEGVRTAATTRQKLCFCAGMTMLWMGADWPVHDLAEDYLFSVHMVQHTLFSLMAPPLILLGLPAWLVRIPLSNRRVLAAMKFLTRPLFALLLFNAVVVGTHWPVIVDASLHSEPLHFLVHLVLFSTSILMWWPVVDPVPELARMSPPGKMLYLFLQSVVPTVPASFLTFAQEPIYKFYVSVPRLINLSPLEDQQIAGLIMKLGGGLLLWSVIATLFFKWNSREERGEIPELSWDDFEHDLKTWTVLKERTNPTS